MPKWEGPWLGGRWYRDRLGRPVYFIERGSPKRTIRLVTHDEEIAKSEFGRFTDDPEGYWAAYQAKRNAPPPTVRGPVYITEARIGAYLEHIKDRVADYRTARARYLAAWATKGLDLRTATRQQLREVLASFDGGYRGRAETLNGFGSWLEAEEVLEKWRPLPVKTQPTDPELARAERVCYSLEQLRACWKRLHEPLAFEADNYPEEWKEARRADRQAICAVFYLRAATGMHQTEINQLAGAPTYDGPLPDKGVGVRLLGDRHPVIKGVLQVMHKSRHRHRQPLDAMGLNAALVLRHGVPARVSVWSALKPLVPSNLRHTFVTLAGELGEEINYTAGGVDRARVARAVGHRAGSTMTADRYEKIQVPPLLRLPLGLEPGCLQDAV